jgi:hypothetical protein
MKRMNHHTINDRPSTINNNTNLELQSNDQTAQQRSKQPQINSTTMMPSHRLLRHLSILRTIPTVVAAASRPASTSTSSAFLTTSSSIRPIHSNSAFPRPLSVRTMSTQPEADDILSQYSNLELEGNNVGYAMEMLAKADAVCFDVDSTVIDEEGIVS